MGLGPGVPEDGEGIAGVGLDVGGARGGALVAGDVGGVEGVGLHEPVVLVHSLPAGRLRRRALRLVVPVRVGALDPAAAVDLHAGDVAVRRRERQERDGVRRESVEALRRTYSDDTEALGAAEALTARAAMVAALLNFIVAFYSFLPSLFYY